MAAPHPRRRQTLPAVDLPGAGNPCGYTTPVDVLEDLSPEAEGEATDEGRAMAQIVHDLAPGLAAGLRLRLQRRTDFANNIERLAAPVRRRGAGATVIADDVTYIEEPFFQDGPVGVAIDKVAAEASPTSPRRGTTT